MAMAIMNNSSVALSLSELNKNTNKLNKDLKKAATGTKITGADVGASEYAQSEKLRSLVRALGQDIENSQKGITLVKTAEDGIQGIVDSLRTMRELAINSLNDHNSDEDRKILQKEFASRMAEIDELASDTNYNGIILLDGRWRQTSGEGEFVTHTAIKTETEYETITEPITKTVTTYEEVTEEYTETVTTYEEKEEEYTETITTYEEVIEEYPYTYTKTTEKPLESNAVRPSAATPTGVIDPGENIQTPTKIIFKSNYTITEDGYYAIPEDYTGTLNIQAKNVKLTMINKNKSLSNVNIVTSSAGGTNLWIEDLIMRYANPGGKDMTNISQPLIRFRGNNNVLTVKGRNTFSPATSASAIHTCAFINVGSGLTIEGNGTLDFYQQGFLAGAYGALIGTNQGQSSNATITINSGRIITSSNDSVPWGRLGGAVIGSGSGGSIGNIIINGGTFDMNIAGGSACIGGGAYAKVGNISIQDAIINAVCDDGACIGGGSSAINNNTSAGDIYILNSTLDLKCVEIGGHPHDMVNPKGIGAAIGGGGTWGNSTSTVGDITIENSTVKAVTDKGACIGTGGDAEYNGNGEPSAHGIKIIDSTLDLTANDSRAETIGKGVNGIIPTQTVEEEITEMRTRTVTVPREETVTKTRTILVPHEETVTKTRTVLVPHEEIVTVNHTHTVSHEITKTVEYQEKVESAKNPLVIHTGPKSNQYLSLHINDMRLKAMNLDNAAVDPREKAKDALEKLDLAVEYALNENVRMGAYQARLSETINNLVTAQENALNSESMIRDADMAKEMTNYTKDNILAQAAQSMLAQANQNFDSVLSLLQ